MISNPTNTLYIAVFSRKDCRVRILCATAPPTTLRVHRILIPLYFSNFFPESLGSARLYNIARPELAPYAEILQSQLCSLCTPKERVNERLVNHTKMLIIIITIIISFYCTKEMQIKKRVRQSLYRLVGGDPAHRNNKMQYLSIIQSKRKHKKHRSKNSEQNLSDIISVGTKHRNL